ncbi:hypothetical protein SNE40_016195 [Patella caerulea]|uniref:Uncharacterized protein n=1 Tax=Patella caerulea TaxID=87958 RepID=A0AAN8JDQ0_PATCE
MRVLIILALYICFMTRNKTTAMCTESKRNTCNAPYLDGLVNLADSSGKSREDIRKEFCSIIATMIRCYKNVDFYISAAQEKAAYDGLAKKGIHCGGCMATYSYVLMSLSAVLIMVNNKF